MDRLQSPRPSNKLERGSPSFCLGRAARLAVMEERVITLSETTAVILKGRWRHRRIAESWVTLDIRWFPLIDIAPCGCESIVKTLARNLRVIWRRRGLGIVPVVDENIQPEREAAAMLPGQAISSYRVLIVVFDVSPIRRARPSQILNPRSDKGLRQSRPGSSVARHSRECRYAFQRKQRVDLPTNSTFREPGALMFVGVKRKRVRPPALQNRQRVRRPRPQKIHNCTSS